MLLYFLNLRTKNKPIYSTIVLFHFVQPRVLWDTWNSNNILSNIQPNKSVAELLIICKEKSYRNHNSVFYLNISKANDESCSISRKTVQIVDECPDSLEKWKKAAMIKNCTAYANQCSKPKKLQYHCVINPFVNETIEVCAYAKNIVLGRYFYRFIILKKYFKTINGSLYENNASI